MKKFMLFILVSSFALSAFAQAQSTAQGQAPAANASEAQNYLEVINNPESNLTEKSFARLFLSAPSIKLEGQVQQNESFAELKVNFENYASNLFGMFSFGSDEEDEDPTNIQELLAWECKADGKCDLKILNTSGVKKKYAFEVLLDEQQKPVAVKDNKVVVTVEQ
jgi:hypothetical protein